VMQAWSSAPPALPIGEVIGAARAGLACDNTLGFDVLALGEKVIA
jgi:hypothetical protein